MYIKFHWNSYWDWSGLTETDNKPSQETSTRTPPTSPWLPSPSGLPQTLLLRIAFQNPSKTKSLSVSVSVSSPHPIHPPLHDHDVQASIHPRRRLRAIASVLCFPRLPEPRIRKALRWGSRIWDRRAHRWPDLDILSSSFFFVCVSVRFSVLRCLPFPTLGFCFFCFLLYVEF